METEINKVKNKLTKLLKLAECGSASQGEIDNAFAMANQLMTKYQLTRDDVDLNSEKPTAKIKYVRNFAFTLSPKLYQWERNLANFVCAFMGSVKCYIQDEVNPVRKNGFAEVDAKGNPRCAKSFCFYGSEDDCEVAVELYYELQEAIQTMAIIRFASWAKGDGGAYCEGFVYGLKQANIKSIELLKNTDNQTTALMLVSEQTQLAIRKGADEFLSKACGVKLRNVAASSGASSGSGQARNEGIQDGRKYETSKPTVSGKLN